MKQGISRAGSLALLLLLLLGLTGCSLIEGFLGDGEEQVEVLEEEEEDPEYPVEIGGAVLAVYPQRVVSLSPALTEKVLDLGLSDQLVGVSRYCGEALPGAADLADCGTVLLPDIEAIRELEPYLVLASDYLPEDALIQLQQMGIEVAVLQRADSLEDLLARYTDIAMLLQGNLTGGELGEAFAQQFDERLTDILVATAPYAGDVVLYLRAMPFVMATGDTVEHQLLNKAAMFNVAEEGQGWQYPAEEAEENRAQFEQVSMIFLEKSTVTIGDLEQHDFYKTLPAVLQDRYTYMDAAAFERQGLSMLDELERMALACYPDCGLNPPSRAEGAAEEPEQEQQEAEQQQGLAQELEDAA